ncbi:MAG: cytochrome c [Enterobacterales bacterium]|nr:cytochrome c [Enterobacterales bacterium]
MNKCKIISLGFVLLGGASLAAVSEQENVTLKGVMQGLLKSNLKLNESIVLQNFSAIELAANQIGHHPKPDMKIRMQLVKNMGTEMGQFKSMDNVVHNAALAIEAAAKSQDMEQVLVQYSTMIKGCQACHGKYKKRVAEIFK